MVALIPILFLQADLVPEVKDYFPSKVGTVWEYQENDNPSSQYEDRVVNSVEINKSPTITIETKRMGKSLGTSHYMILNNTVLAVAFNTSLIIDRPHPILRLDKSKLLWEYKGTTPKEGGSVPMEFKASSFPHKSQELFGKLRTCYQVDMTVKFKEAGGLLDFEVKQSSVHANGVGMVELTETTLFNKQTSVRKVKLVRFEQPQ